MSFLPLARYLYEVEHGRMHPYVIDRMIHERQDELVRLRATDGPRGEDVAGWRRRAGRALGSLAAALAVPRAMPTAAHRQVGATSCLDR